MAGDCEGTREKEPRNEERKVIKGAKTSLTLSCCCNAMYYNVHLLYY